MVNKDKDEEAIFDAAIEFESRDKRDAYLAEACGTDEKLRADVEALLKAHYEAKSLLDEPAVGPEVIMGDSPLTEGPGTRIGRYKLLQMIGEGGFGVVYMAEQEKPIRRRVALKIIKLGMDTKQVIARFEAERQALALMEHPNIAKVLDAGATDTGRPYFVMELVKGIPITEYCDKSNLDTRHRLELFIEVCRAVQHAHQKGIIHRDIKPTNVLVTLRDDDTPVPKIIDFGIAKATQARLTEKTLFTEFKQFIGTPEYMSPEQARMSEVDIDTRSDIYALGVLLYELLTGTTPFDREELRSSAYDEMLKTIQEAEPPKPSTRLNTLGDVLTEVAKHRHAEPSELCKIISGDLDWIVLKTLEKERTRRYETANELVADIQRHLGDEPVIAGPPSTLYRLRKFGRRHRTGVMFGLLVAAALLIGLSLAVVGFVRASRARARAEDQREQAEANFKMAREAVDRMLTQVAEELPRLPGMPERLDAPQVAQIKRALLEDALEYYEGFLEERSSDPLVRYETAHAYLRVGDITKRMRQYERAEETYVAAANLLEELAAEFPNELNYHLDLAHSYHGQADLLRDTGRLKEAEQVYREALFSYGNAIELNPSNSEHWHGRAYVYGEMEKWDSAIADFSKAIELDPGNANHWHRRAEFYSDIMQQGDKAFADYSKAIELGPNNPWAWHGRGGVYQQKKQWEKAIADCSKAIELDPATWHHWDMRAGVYTHLKQWDKAIADYSKAIELDRNNSGRWEIRGRLYIDMERWDEAIADLSKAIELDPNNSAHWHDRADAYSNMKQWDKAIADFSKAIELDPATSHHWRRRGGVYSDMEEWEAAIADFSKAIELGDDWHSWNGRFNAYQQLGQQEKGLADYYKAIELDPNNWRLWQWRGDAYTYFNMKQADKAIADYSKAIELNPNHSHLWKNRARVYAGMKQWDEALADYSQASLLEPTWWEHWHERGWVYSSMEKWEEARADFSKSIELTSADAEGPESRERLPQMYRSLGDVLEKMGRSEEAQQAYQKAEEIEEDPIRE